MASKLGRLHESPNKILFFSKSRGRNPPEIVSEPCQTIRKQNHFKKEKIRAVRAVNLEAARRFNSATAMARRSTSDGKGAAL